VEWVALLEVCVPARGREASWPPFRSFSHSQT